MSKANRKEHLLIESGIRIHTTNYIKNQKDLPSGFSMKLRKHLRTRKCEDIQQLGIDRVVDLTFGKGEFAHHILVELYASGNVILTDHEYTILSLLRSHKFEENARIAVKQKYPFGHAANLTLDSIITDKEEIGKILNPAEKEEVVEVIQEEKKVEQKSGNKKGGGGKKQNQQPKKKEEKMTLKFALTKIVPYASIPYADHVLRELKVDPNTKASSDQHIDLLIQAANDLRKLVQSMENLEEIKGFITFVDEEKKENRKEPENGEEENKEGEEEFKSIQQLKAEAGEKILNA